MQKRQFTDRAYFIDSFTPTEGMLTQQNQQKIEELEFLVDKLKDDLQEMTKTSVTKGKEDEK